MPIPFLLYYIKREMKREREDNEPCCICFENIVEGHESQTPFACKTDVKHSVCNDCFEKMLTNNLAVCPLCREPIKSQVSPTSQREKEYKAWRCSISRAREQIVAALFAEIHREQFSWYQDMLSDQQNWKRNLTKIRNWARSSPANARAAAAFIDYEFRQICMGRRRINSELFKVRTLLHALFVDSHNIV